MIELSIPGYGDLSLSHLVSDFNGTLACDGILEQGVAERLTGLAGLLEVTILTADTHGTASEVFKHLPVRLLTLPPGGEAERKGDYVEELGAAGVVFLGNGANDVIALERARLAIAVISREGASSEAVLRSDLVTRSATEALELLLTPKRLVAGLRR